MTASTTDPSTSTTASTTDPSTTEPTTTSESTTTDATTTESSTDPDGSSTEASTEPESSSSSDGSSSSDTGDDGAIYRAVALIGGLNRVRIFKRNDADDLCTFVSLVDPSFGAFGSIDVTQPWGVEYAGITDSAAACDSDNPLMFGSDEATDGDGAIDLADVGMGGVPCTVDIDVSLDFDGAVLQVPDSDTMTATDLPVQGC